MQASVWGVRCRSLPSQTFSVFVEQLQIEVVLKLAGACNNLVLIKFGKVMLKKTKQTKKHSHLVGFLVVPIDIVQFVFCIV